jgi:hypothetical protein
MKLKKSPPAKKKGRNPLPEPTSREIQLLAKLKFDAKRAI